MPVLAGVEKHTPIASICKTEKKNINHKHLQDNVFSEYVSLCHIPDYFLLIPSHALLDFSFFVSLCHIYISVEILSNPFGVFYPPALMVINTLQNFTECLMVMD